MSVEARQDVWHLRVTTRGRITIPAELRRRHGIKPGNRVEFDEVDGSIEIRPVTSPTQPAVDESTASQAESK